MKKWITGFCIFIFLMTFAVGQDWQVIKEQSNDILPDCGFFLDANNGWLVVDEGEVWKTTDAGANWTKIHDSDSSGYYWQDIEFFDANTGYVAADDGMIFKTMDGGANWTMIGDTANYKMNFYDLSVVNADLVFFAGADSTLLKTDNGGTSYTRSAEGFGSENLDGGIAFCNENVGVLAIDNSKVGDTYYTIDGGTTWNKVNIAALFPVGTTSYRLYDVAAYGDGTIAIAGYHTCGFFSSDSGQSYTMITDVNYGYEYFSSVAVLDENTVIFAGSDSRVVKTSDGGASTDTLYIGTGQTVNFIDFVDVNNGFIFTSYGQWYKTVDGGSNWTPLLDWPQLSLWGLAFPTDKKIVLSAYAGGEISISEDGGKTWSYPSNYATGIFENLYECEFADADNGLIGGGYGALAKTTDGGATWTAIENTAMYINANKHINAINYFDPNTAFVGGSSGYVMRTTDGGANWSDTKVGSGTVYDIWPLDANTVIAAESSGQIRYGVFDGDTVVKDSLLIDVGGNSMRAVEVRNNVVIVPASSGVIFRTTLDNLAGLAAIFTDPDGKDLYDVEFVNDSLVYVVGDLGKIYKSTDAGLTWTLETLPSQIDLRKVRLQGSKLWIVGEDGLVLMLDLTEPYELPIIEAATDGTFDLEWTINETAGAGSLAIVDSTGSAWGSHVIAYTDQGYTGIAHVDYAVFSDITISADVYLVGPADASAPLYAGITIRTEHSPLSYYRFIYRNSSSSDNGQLKLQGFDGAAWHISAAWNPGVDFTALETGWHNMKITVVGNDFYAFIDGELLPGCPFHDDTPFLTEGYPGVYVYNSTPNTVMFDNFTVTEPEEIPEVGVGTEGLLPKTYALHQNYPNPFNPTTTIAFDMPQAGAVKVIVYNMVGQQVRTLVNDYVAAGTNYIVWDARDNFGRNLSSGVYLYQLVTDEKTITKRMVLLK